MKTILLTMATLAGTVGAANAWTKSVESGLYSSTRSSTDDGIAKNPNNGLYVAGNMAGAMGSFKVALDGRVELGLGDRPGDNHDTGPMQSGVFGLHLGQDRGENYIGGFAALGIYDGTTASDSESKIPQVGGVIGAEIVRPLTQTVTVTGQLGYAIAVSDDDQAYRGYVAHLGFDAHVNDRLTAVIGFDTGRSNDSFVDTGGQPGAFFAVSLAGEYALNDRFTLIGSVNQLRIEDYDDPDTGKDLSVFLGARVALGDKSVPAHRLSTPMQVFRAAGWMQTLD